MQHFMVPDTWNMEISLSDKTRTAYMEGADFIVEQ